MSFYNTKKNNSNIKKTREEKIKRKYNKIDAENKIKGVRFTKLINSTNDIISNTNTKKENTQF